MSTRPSYQQWLSYVYVFVGLRRFKTVVAPSCPLRTCTSLKVLLQVATMAFTICSRCFLIDSEGLVTWWAKHFQEISALLSLTAKSHSKSLEMAPLDRLHTSSYSSSIKICLSLVPLLINSASNIGVTLKFGLWIAQGH